ncbi:unnamed protein product [Orchesella dallaii]|uniref:Uncharacterized protein n=1 Tax=Orchesella dallaii TaxID=48710 RepID=A0ABP1Q4R7_9HEXA
MDNSSLRYFLVILWAILVLETLLITAEWNKIESPCLCQEFRCKDGTFCLDKSKVCNGVRDCIGGEDERGYNGTGKCVRKRAECGKDEFKCKFGDCIKLEKVCDGQIDCWGAVDEAIDFCTWVHGNETSADTDDGTPKSI